MPMDIDIEQLDDGDECEVTIRRHHASWHKSCPLKFNITQLDHLMRRNIQKETAEEERKRWKVHKKRKKKRKKVFMVSEHALALNDLSEGGKMFLL